MFKICGLCRKGLIIAFLFGVLQLTILVAIPLINAKIINSLIIKDWADFKYNVVLASVLIFSQLIIGFFTRYITILVNEIFGKELRRNLMAAYLSKGASFLDDVWIGDLIARASNDTELVKIFFTQFLLQIMLDFLTLLLVMGVLFYNHSLLALFILISAPLSLIAGHYFKSRIENWNAKVRESFSNLTEGIKEILTNFLGIKIHRLESIFEEKYQYVNDQYKRNNTRLGLYTSFVGSMNMFLLSIPSLLVLVIGGYMSLNGEISIGLLFAFITYATFFNAPILRIVSLINIEIPKLYPVFERINEYLLIKRKPQIKNDFKKEPQGIVRLEANDLDFEYEDRSFRICIKEFRAKMGEIVGITGSNGSGKTTFAKLLCGLISPSKGNIFVFKRNGEKVPKDTLDTFSDTFFLTQDHILFKGSYEDNISLFDRPPKFEKIKSIGEILNITQFENLKSESSIMHISNGEKQKISLARLMYSNKEIVVLDEPESSLDEISKELLQEILDMNKSNKIQIVITHDSKILNKCDLVYQIANQNENYHLVLSEKCNG